MKNSENQGGDETQDQLHALNDIRRMMRDSSRFLSLNGLSGVFVGVYALAAAWLASTVVNSFHGNSSWSDASYVGMVMRLCGIGLSVLALSLSTAFYFSARKAKKDNRPLFDHSSRRLVVNMFGPLIAGGVFCIALVSQHVSQMICSGMLLFYGLALVNCSKYTISDLRVLGYLQVVCGLVAAFLPELGLMLWALGFGVLHIIYGSIMWYKYDRETA